MISVLALLLLGNVCDRISNNLISAPNTFEFILFVILILYLHKNTPFLHFLQKIKSKLCNFAHCLSEIKGYEDIICTLVDVCYNIKCEI